jgi:hypothetical protein
MESGAGEIVAPFQREESGERVLEHDLAEHYASDEAPVDVACLRFLVGAGRKEPAVEKHAPRSLPYQFREKAEAFETTCAALTVGVRDLAKKACVP